MVELNALLRFLATGVAAIGLFSTQACAPIGAGSELPACDSPEAMELLKNAFEQNVVSNLLTVQLLDAENMVERSYDPAKPERVCAADLFMNYGREHVGYRIWNSNQGSNLLLEVVDDPGPSVAAPLAQSSPAEPQPVYSAVPPPAAQAPAPYAAAAEYPAAPAAQVSSAEDVARLIDAWGLANRGCSAGQYGAEAHCMRRDAIRASLDDQGYCLPDGAPGDNRHDWVRCDQD